MQAIVFRFKQDCTDDTRVVTMDRISRMDIRLIDPMGVPVGKAERIAVTMRDNVDAEAIALAISRLPGIASAEITQSSRRLTTNVFIAPSESSLHEEEHVTVYTDIREKQSGRLLCRIDGPTLQGADLSHQSLSSADLHGANLRGTLLINVTLRNADLSEADLYQSTITQAFADNANFSGADLSNANIRHSDFQGVDLTNAKLSSTNFSNCRNLHTAIGLETIRYGSPSPLDPQTLRNSIDKLPEVFLQGIGYSPEETAMLRTLYRQGDPLFSCFISYRQTDAAFARKLAGDLTDKGVKCWMDIHHMVGGKFYRSQISKAIKEYDKMILVCSKESMLRENVIEEILSAMEREREGKGRKLFPIRLDDYILSEEMLAIADEKLAFGEWKEDWVRHVRAFHIPDFSNWTDEQAYQREFSKFVSALR